MWQKRHFPTISPYHACHAGWFPGFFPKVLGRFPTRRQGRIVCPIQHDIPFSCANRGSQSWQDWHFCSCMQLATNMILILQWMQQKCTSQPTRWMTLFVHTFFPNLPWERKNWHIVDDSTICVPCMTSKTVSLPWISPIFSHPSTTSLSNSVVFLSSSQVSFPYFVLSQNLFSRR